MSDQQLYTVRSAVVKVSVGGTGHRIAQILRRGDVVPTGVDQEALDRLEERGLIEKVDAPESPGDPGTSGPVKPAANAGVDKWLGFASELGVEIPAEAVEDKAKVRELVDAHLEAAAAK